MKALCILIALIVIILWITPQMRLWLGVEAPAPPAASQPDCPCRQAKQPPADAQPTCPAQCGQITIYNDPPPIKLLVQEPTYTYVYSEQCGYQPQFCGMRTYEVTALYDCAQRTYWYYDRYGVAHIYAPR